MRFATALIGVCMLGLAACRANDEESLGENKLHHDALDYPEGDGLDVPKSDGVTERTVLYRNAAKTRLWYTTARGDVRVLYIIGKRPFIGPLVRSPIDWKAVPDLDHALGAIYAEATSRRTQLATEIQRERGHAGLVQLLLAAVWVDGPEWAELRKQVVPDDDKWFRDAMTLKLTSNDPLVIARAVPEADLLDKSLAKLVAEKAELMVKHGGEARVTTALLHATYKTSNADVAAKIGCEVLATRTETPLVATAIFVTGRGKADCDRQQIEKYLAPACSYDCSLADGECNSMDFLRDIIRKDENGTTADFMNESQAGAESRLAHLALYQSLGNLPAWFTQQDARRRYEIKQSANPDCDKDGVHSGTSCHCDEDDLHLTACMAGSLTQAVSGSCSFDIDDTKKLITNVKAH
jgi:hypothetical protein